MDKNPKDMTDEEIEEEYRRTMPISQRIAMEEMRRWDIIKERINRINNNK